MVGAILNFNPTQLVRFNSLGPTHHSACVCNSCSSTNLNSTKLNLVQQPSLPNVNTPQQTQPVNSTDEDDEPEGLITKYPEGYRPEDALPPAILKKLPETQDIQQKEHINDTNLSNAISPQAQEISPNDKKLNEVIEGIPEDLAEAKQYGLQNFFLFDPTTHAYIQIYNRTGHNFSSMQEAVQYVLSKAPQKLLASIVGVMKHENLHVDELRKIPHIDVEEFIQGVKVYIDGDYKNPEFDNIPFGQTALRYDRLYDAVDQQAQYLQGIEQQITQAQQTGFRGWTQDAFVNLVQNLKQSVLNLQFLTHEAYQLGIAAIAPLVLNGTIYDEQKITSPADMTRYEEAHKLLLDIGNLIDGVAELYSITEGACLKVYGGAVSGFKDVFYKAQSYWRQQLNEMMGKDIAPPLMSPPKSYNVSVPLPGQNLAGNNLPIQINLSPQSQQGLQSV
ncbi:MAG TPA: hypothetical protein V6C96_00565 [Vampirovibrionales bacterium]